MNRKIIDYISLGPEAASSGIGQRIALLAWWKTWLAVVVVVTARVVQMSAAPGQDFGMMIGFLAMWVVAIVYEVL